MFKFFLSFQAYCVPSVSCFLNWIITLFSRLKKVNECTQGSAFYLQLPFWPMFLSSCYIFFKCSDIRFFRFIFLSELWIRLWGCLLIHRLPLDSSNLEFASYVEIFMTSLPGFQIGFFFNEFLFCYFYARFCVSISQFLFFMVIILH